MNDTEALAKLSEARLLARLAYPEYGHAIFSMSLVVDASVGTAGVDKYGRIYFAPAFVEQYEIGGLAFFIIHEVTHFLRHHSARADVVGVTEQNHTTANIAMDAVIHETMLADNRLAMPDPKHWVTLDKYDLEPNKTWEEHFAVLLERAKDKGNSGGDDKGQGSGQGDGRPQPNCGSGATGVPGSWEQGEPTTESGISPAQAEEMRRQVARDIQERASRGRGTLPGHMTRWAEELLNKNIDPTKAIRQMLNHALGAVTSGSNHSSYSRMNRHAVAFPSNVILPGHYDQLPKVELAVDTSGSMSAEQINLAASALKPILRSFGGRCRLTSGDVGVQASRVVSRARGRMELGGDGGTDMGKLLQDIAGRKHVKDIPDIVLLATDGQTPWPAYIRKFKVIVLLLGEPTTNLPSWMKTVDCRSLLEG
jgi:predicted metal-dependent peptidase